jgi:hypothetical protein
MPDPTLGYGPAGTTATGRTPTSEQLYASPDEMNTLFGMTVTEGQIRYAMGLIHAYCCRRSLWPEEYEERLAVPPDRNPVILAARPVLQLVAAAGRYGYGRRDRRTLNALNADALAVAALMGAPPAFANIDVEQCDVYGPTGEVWLPTGLFLVAYSEVQVRYTAGLVDMPFQVKAAMAEILNTIRAKGVADRHYYTVNKVQRQFSRASFLSEDAERFLAPYVIRTLC